MELEHAASLTARAVKKALPDRAILTREAQRKLNSATSVFTLYLSSLYVSYCLLRTHEIGCKTYCAHETSVSNKRSTVTLKDVLQTLQDVNFEHFIEPIEACVRETKAMESKKRKHQDTIEVEDGAETTSEVIAQLDDVAIDTNDEDDADGMSVDELLNIEAESGDADKNGTDDAVQDEATGDERDSQMAQMGKTEDEDDNLTEAMEQS